MLNLDPCQLTELPICMCACTRCRPKPLSEIRLTTTPTRDDFRRVMHSILSESGGIERMMMSPV